MKYLLKMSWRFLREQKLRTFLTAACLTLAVFVVGVCGVFGSSALFSARNIYRLQYGSYHFSLNTCVPDGESLSPEAVDILRYHNAISDFGEAYSYSLENFPYDSALSNTWLALEESEPGARLNCWRITVDDYSCVSISSYAMGFINYDEKLSELIGIEQSMSSNSLIGRMPEQAGEIVLPLNMRSGYYDSWLKDMALIQDGEGGVQGKGYQIGDTIHLTIQNGITAYSGDKTEDQQMLQAGAAVQASYKVVGFQDGAFQAVVHTSDTQLAALRYSQPDRVYCRIRDGLDFTATLNELMKAVGLKSILEAGKILYQNEDLLMLELRGDDTMVSFAACFGLVFLLCIFLFFFIRLVIDNAFEMSTQERVRQFAILRTVGASRWQIAVMVMLEGIMYAVVAIPLGISGACLLGYADLESFRSGVEALYAESYAALLSQIQFHLFSPIMILTVLIAVWSILISAYTSAMWAAKVDPMQAAQFGRPKKEKKIHHKACKTRHRFGFALYFSRLNQKRNKKRYRITMFSIAMGMVMFMTCYGLNRTIRYMLDVEMGNLRDAQVSISADQYTAAQGLALLRESGLFSDCSVSERVVLELDPALLQEMQQETDDTDLIGIYRPTDNAAYFLPVDQVEYEAKYEKAVGLSYADFCSSGGLYLGSTALVYVEKDSGLSTGYYKEVEVLKPTTKPIPAKLTVNRVGEDSEGGFEMIKEPVTICGVFDSTACSDLMSESLSNGIPIPFGIVDVNHLEEYRFMRDYQGKWKQDVNDYTMNYAPGKQQEAKKWFAQKQQEGLILDYNGECSAELEVSLLVLELFTRLCYHFVLIVLAISVFTIMNTMNTAVLNRRHELGMLRAVGMSAKQMRLTLLSEACRYVIKAGIGGSLVAGAICFYLVNTSYYTSKWIWFVLPGVLIAMGVGLVFAVLSTLVPLRNLEKQDAAQVIREIN